MRGSEWGGWWVFLGVLVACTGGPAVPEGSVGGPLERGWPARLVAAPEEFASLVSDPSARAGWIAFHGADFREAQAGGGAPGARGWAEEAVLQRDLERLAALTWRKMGETWAQRSQIPSGSALPVVVALSQLSVPEAEPWLSLPDHTYSDPDVAALAAVLRAGGLSAVEGQGAVSGCVAAHRRVRLGTAAPSLLSLACPPSGVLVVEAGGGRTLWNPLVYGTLATRAEREAAAHAEALTGLSAEIFSASWGEEEGGEAMLEALGVPRPTADDPEQGRRLVQALDGHLDAWVSGVQGDAATSAEGSALLVDLAVVAHWRSRVLLAVARGELQAGRAHVARVVGTLALDARTGRAVGALNPPGLFVVLAEANLRVGRSREALDMLVPLRSDWPEVEGLEETLGDLVILEGLDRIGDSKEN